MQKRSHTSYNGPRDYNAAVAALNSLQSNFAVVEAIRKQGPGVNKQSLPAMREWARRIGYEPSDFDTLNPVHIAGTKGKGSTSSFISSILAQYLPTPHSIPAERLPSSVGLYSSPHLRFVRERIKINNQPISEELFAKCFWEIWDRLEATAPASETAGASSDEGKPKYFHYLTLMALHCYVQEKVGTAVIECGIGGEYDTTNILVKPTVTGVTSLGIDHEHLLGDAIESIAWHKGGIFKPDVPAFTVPQPEKAMEVLHGRARERQTELHIVQRHAALDTINLGLQGEFQKTNASLAIAVSAQLLHRLGYNNIPDPGNQNSQLPAEFITGLESARLGGRCDMRPDTKLPNLTWYIDGGHTLESIEMAARWFASSISSSTISTAENITTRILLFNQQTRNASLLAQRLHTTLSSALNTSQQPFKHAIFTSNVTYSSAGYSADLVSMNTNKEDIDSLKVQRGLAATWDEIDPGAEVCMSGSVEEAVGTVREIAAGGKEKVQVLVTGSLHLVGGVVEVLEGEVERGESKL